MMCLQGKCIPCKLIKQISPLLACQEIYKGLTVAPHGDGFFLKESRIQRIDLWSRPVAYCLAHPFLSLDQLPQYEDITSAEKLSQSIYLPTLQSQHFFFFQGSFELVDPLYHLFLQTKNKPILNLPLLLHETKLDCRSHMFLYLV